MVGGKGGARSDVHVLGRGQAMQQLGCRAWWQRRLSCCCCFCSVVHRFTQVIEVLAYLGGTVGTWLGCNLLALLSDFGNWLLASIDRLSRCTLGRTRRGGAGSRRRQHAAAAAAVAVAAVARLRSTATAAH